MSEEIRLVTQPGIAEIILNRPEKRNALSSRMWGALPGLVAQANKTAQVRVILIHGGASGAFAAGADISEFETLYSEPASAAAESRRMASALKAVEESPVPVIAAIEGACVGGGVSLALATDLRIASASSTFAITPGRLGLAYPPDDTRRLIAAVGPGPARDLLYTARNVGAVEARTIGLVDRVTDTASCLAEARAWADQIASVSPWSLRAIKRMIRLVTQAPNEKAEEAEALFLEGFTGHDFVEGYRAFLEKRPADFTDP